MLNILYGAVLLWSGIRVKNNSMSIFYVVFRRSLSSCLLVLSSCRFVMSFCLLVVSSCHREPRCYVILPVLFYSWIYCGAKWNGSCFTMRKLCSSRHLNRCWFHNALCGGLVACERQTFLLAHHRWETLRKEETSAIQRQKFHTDDRKICPESGQKR